MKNLKVVTWTLVGIIAAVIVTSIILVVLQKAAAVGILLSLWSGIAIGATVTVLYRIWKNLRKQNNAAA